MCDKGNSPIDIRQSRIIGTCNSKCKLSTNYKVSNCVVKGSNDKLVINYDKNNSPPAIFNQHKYNVSDITLFSPSLHSFNGNKADAELCIMHTTKGNNLLLCIPIMTSMKQTESSRILESIVSGVTQLAPNYESVTLNVDDFTLQHFIPNKQLFYYEGNKPYGNCNGSYNIVVFHTNDKATISAITLSKLQKYIKPHSYKVKDDSNVSLFLSGSYTAAEQAAGKVYVEITPLSSNEIGDEEIREKQRNDIRTILNEKENVSSDMSNLDTVDNTSIVYESDTQEGFTVANDQLSINDIVQYGIASLLLVSIGIVSRKLLHR